jgi:bifunctional lysine-specific demethylase and histidyl-hydroxylase NO66
VGDAERFVQEFWATRPQFHRSPPGGGFDDLLTLSDVDHMLSTMSLRTPTFRLVKDGTTLDPADYTRTARTGSATASGVADPARIFRLFHEGATIVLQGMHRYWPPLARFCRDLELALGHPTQVNGYVTPPGSRGLAVHHDSHDVFVLQAFGAKSWEVYEPGREDGTPQMAIRLDPGDSLYMPRGTPHGARTQETVSGHLTVGILTYTWSGVFREALERIASEAELDEPLPVAFHRDRPGFQAALEDRLQALRVRLDKVDPQDLADRMVRKFLTTRPSLAEGTLQAIAGLEDVTDRSVLRKRPGGICELQLGGDRLHVFLGDRELLMPAWAMPPMRTIAERETFAPSDLADHLDPESRLVLARRLIREGLLEAAEAGQPGG